MNILELRKVNKSFGKLQALSDINFELKQGEIFGLAGPNGSGKTTLFNVITGIHYAGMASPYLSGYRTRSSGHTLPTI